MVQTQTLPALSNRDRESNRYQFPAREQKLDIHIKTHIIGMRQTNRSSGIAFNKVSLQGLITIMYIAVRFNYDNY